jgi:hypothetical protein
MRLKRACLSPAEDDEQRKAACPRPRRRPAGLNTTPVATEIPAVKATIVSVRLPPESWLGYAHMHMLRTDVENGLTILPPPRELPNDFRVF